MNRTTIVLLGLWFSVIVSSVSNADISYRTFATGNIGIYDGAPNSSSAAHDQTWTGSAGTTRSIASASGNQLNSFTSSGNGNGAAPMYLTTSSEYRDEIVIDWDGASSVMLALNTEMSGSLNLSGWAFAELRLFSYLGGTGSGMFTGGGPGLTSRYAPLHLDGPRCEGRGGFCDAFSGFPTTFDTSAQLGTITVATNTPLPFVYQLDAYTSVGTSGGNFGNGSANVSANLPEFSDIFTVFTDGFDGNIYSTSGVINNNRWVHSVPEPNTSAMIGLVCFGFCFCRKRRLQSSA